LVEIFPGTFETCQLVSDPFTGEDRKWRGEPDSVENDPELTFGAQGGRRYEFPVNARNLARQPTDSSCSGSSRRVRISL
jgi:hypothetical protein